MTCVNQRPASSTYRVFWKLFWYFWLLWLMPALARSLLASMIILHYRLEYPGAYLWACDIMFSLTVCAFALVDDRWPGNHVRKCSTFLLHLLLCSSKNIFCLLSIDCVATHFPTLSSRLQLALHIMIRNFNATTTQRMTPRRLKWR